MDNDSVNAISVDSPDVAAQSALVTAPMPAVSGLADRAQRWWYGSGRAAVALRGGAWSISGYVVTQLLRTVATLVLARHFLEPDAFGVVGLVGVFLSGLSMFSELGIVANVVQHRRGDETGFLRTAFSIQAARGVVIWIIAVFAAYPIAAFYKQPQILPLLIVSGFSELIRGLTSTVAWTHTRHVKLGRITLLTILSEVAGFAVVIPWAILSPSAWALVAKNVATAAVMAAGSHLIVKPRIGFGWDRSAAKDILHFGGWISISTATYFLGGQSERLILGKFVTPAELGCFSLALMIAAIPAGGIGQLVNQIFLPMISATVRTSQTETVRDFVRSRQLFFGIALFAGIGFLTCGKPVTALLLPAKYQMVGWMLQALGVRVALDLFAAPVSSLILAYGQSKYAAAANTTRLVLMVTGIWIAFVKFGIREAIVALIIAQALSYVPLIAALGRVLPEVRRTELKYYTVFLALLCAAALVPWPNL